MDNFEKEHLEVWLDSLFGYRYPKDKEELRKDLIDLTNKYPELLKTHSWPEMHRMIIKSKSSKHS